MESKNGEFAFIWFVNVAYLLAVLAMSIGIGTAMTSVARVTGVIGPEVSLVRWTTLVVFFHVVSYYNACGVRFARDMEDELCNVETERDSLKEKLSKWEALQE